MPPGAVQEIAAPKCSGAPRIWQKGGYKRGSGGEVPSRRRLRRSGGVAPSRQQILRFSHKKTLILSHLFIEKGHAVSAVTRDNAKIFSQLMSQSRSLAKICERRLQPLLVWEIIKWKLGFSTLLKGQRGGAWHRGPPTCAHVTCVALPIVHILHSHAECERFK